MLSMNCDNALRDDIVHSLCFLSISGNMLEIRELDPVHLIEIKNSVK